MTTTVLASENLEKGGDLKCCHFYTPRLKICASRFFFIQFDELVLINIPLDYGNSNKILSEQNI